MTINIRSYNQILGDMVRKIIADTPVNDLNTGSALLSLLEAAAQVDFENNASILSVLELLNIDATRNSDLDSRGADYGLTRIAAKRSTGFVTFKDTSISKRSTGLYQVKFAPIAGSTQIFVNDASLWTNTGTLFIGRGTDSFEGPISYTSITNNGSFFTITLGSALQKDHLISDTVVDAQGTADRLIAAGTSVFIPSNNQNPSIEFRTLRDAVIPSGEDTVENINIVSLLSGSKNNAGINTITQFSSLPFTGATVYNTTSLSDGRDVEADDDFRERIKSYSNTLARGTVSAIVSSIIGVSDSEDGKQVASATITEPPKVGDPSIIYIDDGSGFQPSFSGQSVDKLINSATGNEEFLQLSNFPLPRPQVVNAVDTPYELTEGMQLRVIVDGVEEAITFTSSQFVNIAAARISEVIIAINDQSTLFNATFTENSTRILLFPVAHDAEIIQVSPQKASDNPLLYANSILKFPTNEYSYIRLYQNNTLLYGRQTAATLLSSVYSSWNITVDGNLVVSVDGTPSQDRSFTTSDFGGSSFASLTLDDWVTAFNNKFAGITATATSSGRLQLVSNKEGSLSKLQIVSGSYLEKIFGVESTMSSGQNSDFQLNRQTGNLRILTDIVAGDSISAGIEDAKGSVFSTSTITGVYNVSTDSNGRPAEIIVVSDATNVVPRTTIVITPGNTITISDEGSSIMRIMSNSSTSFAGIQPNDYFYIADRGGSPWVDTNNTGIFKVISKGEHTVAGTDSYIEVKNTVIVPGVYTILASEDIQAFSSDTYPQLWKGTFTPVPASATIQNTVDSFNANLVNVRASIFKTNSVKLTSTTEENGSLATPVSIGRASLIFPSRGEEQIGNPSHVANRTSSKDVVAYFKRTEPTNTNIWLDRVQYTDVKGQLTSNAIPGIDGIDTYSEELQSTSVLTTANVSYDDIYNVNDGANKGQYRSIRDKLSGDKVGTQHELPRTLMDHISNDAFNLMRPVGISSEDSIVFILDQDAVAKTIDISMARRGKVNTGFLATNQSFSADDSDNEPGITFSNLQVWGKTSNSTEFENYAMWMRARNWYVSGGAGSGGGGFVIRSKEYGPHGENLRFRIEYPSFPNQTNIISHSNNPDFTDISYFFGSDTIKSISLIAGDQFTVSNVSGDTYRLTFTTGTVDLSTILVGDIISILSDSGVTAANRGQFRVKAINIVGKTIDIHNPNGAITGVGAPEVTSVTTIADTVGTQTVNTVTTNAVSGTIADNRFFLLNDSAGIVAVVYDKNSAVGTPASYGANRIIKVTLTGAESNATLTALTAGVISADPMFNATYLGNIITVTNIEYGSYGLAADGGTPTTFSFAGTIGSASFSLNEKYFILRDSAGTVAFWYNTSGIASEPLHGASRSVQISTVVSGDSANTIATKTAVAINNDLSFSATALTNVVTVTDVANGARAAASAGTSGFATAQVTNGVDSSFETVSTPTSVMLFSLLNTSVADIVLKIGENPLVNAAAINLLSPIVKATRDEEYTPVGPSNYSASLSFGHDPDPLNSLNEYVSFYDGINWIKQFENTNPNFMLKTAMTLQGAAPAAYSIVTAPNTDDVALGEYFKLVPTTLNNVYHHFTQKALSQLPIVAGVDISNDIRRIQIKSKQLGSSGSVEVVGGNANNISFSIFGEAQATPGLTKNFLEVKAAAFPVTLTTGDIVAVENTLPAKRLSRLSSTDTISVVKGVGSITEYRYNPKTTNTNQFVRFTISDVSGTYGRPSNTVWRWTHNDGGSLFDITGLALGLPSSLPDDEIAAGVTDATNLQIVSVDPGSVSTAQQFQLTVSGVPTQGDYFTFRSAGGVTFAVWFSVNGNVTVPTGATYVSATNKIMVSILNTQTEDQIVSALSTVLLANVNFLAHFSGFQTNGATFATTSVGDLLNAYGSFSASWNSGNKSKATGDTMVSGHPIIGVNAISRYIDIVNPDGVAMTNIAIGSGTVSVYPTPVIQWKLKHSAPTNVSSISLSGPFGTATALTSTEHKLREGETLILSDNGIAQTAVVLSVPNPLSFTFTDTTGAIAGTYIKGNVIRSTRIPTRYKIESLGFNQLFRLSYVDGDAPGFVDCGVAVDDILVIGGSTFKSSNSGRFRVLGVDNTSMIYKSTEAIEELNTVVYFNNLSNSVTWTSNLNEVTGTAGYFKNVSIGDWIKKEEDDDSYYVQVIALLNSSNVVVSATLATKLLLGDNYKGISSVSQGVTFDQNSDVGKGAYLKNMGDISIFEGDSTYIGDSLFVDQIANISWFSTVNSGTFPITQVGTDGITYKPFLRVSNPSSIAQTNRAISVSPIGFFVIESESSKYSSVRVVEHTAIDTFNTDRRVVYLTPATKIDKLSQSNGTTLTPLGKLGYSTSITTGVDGYTYYTGLLRTVQRIVDGFEPDPTNYPGRRAVGGIIETLFPLIKRITVSVDVTTKEGVNLNEVSSDIKSAIINYVSGLGVGEDVILSEITVAIMNITGVAAVTFTVPTPSTERISVSDNEKSFIESQDISVS